MIKRCNNCASSNLVQFEHNLTIQCRNCGWTCTFEMWHLIYGAGQFITKEHAQALMDQMALLNATKEAQWDYRKRAPSEFNVSTDSGLI